MIQYASELYGGSGGGLPVNSIAPIFGGANPPDLYEDTTGGVWLKTGVIETDVSKYPDAHQGFGGLSGNEIDLSADTVALESTSFDGTNFWVVDKTPKMLRKYSFDGTLLKSSYIGDYTSTYVGVAVHGSELITLATSTASIYVFDINTQAYVRTAFNIGDTNFDICFDGTDYFTVTTASQFKQLQVTNGQELNGNVFLSDTPSCVDWDGTHFWVGIPSKNEIVQVNANRQETGVRISLGPTNINIKSIMAANGKIWVGGADGILREIQFGVVGESKAFTDAVTGAPYYVKVK